jgi:hypothetical protein
VLTQRIRTVALESALELQERFPEVGYIKIDVQGHEPQVFEGMMKWLRDDSIAPPFVQFEFDPCLMRSAGTDRTQVVNMLEALVQAGYDLADGKVSEWESKVYAFQELEEKGQLSAAAWAAGLGKSKKKNLDIDAALKVPKLRALIEKKAREMARKRPLECGDLVDWYCPPERSADAWRTYTDVVAMKRSEWRHPPPPPEDRGHRR